jgi:hypothetical protein
MQKQRNEWDCDLKQQTMAGEFCQHRVNIKVRRLGLHHLNEPKISIPLNYLFLEAPDGKAETSSFRD